MFDTNWITFTIAQDTALPPTNGPSGAPAGTVDSNSGATPGTGTLEPGSSPGGKPAGSQSPLGGQFMIIMILVLVTMIIFSMMSSRRDKKKREALINSIKKHDRVQTIGGVIGSVVEVKPDYVVLKVDESSNTRITFARSAIQHVINVSPEPAAAGKDAGK